VRFMAIAKAIIARDLKAPVIYAHNIADGFLILSDFGDLTYLRALETHQPAPLYQTALRALSVLQESHTDKDLSLPHFTHDLMRIEWVWHKEWFLNKLLNLHDATSLLDATYDLLIENALLQPQVFMYRDFHAGNLMLLPDGDVGLLDFQDAFIGPITYDLVSLLRDCYIDWPPTAVMEWALFYYYLLCKRGALQGVSEQQFLKWFDWMGVQRHLKALMTFSRKAVRDHQPNYLKFVPRTLNYIISISHRYDELSAIASFYEDMVLPRFRETWS
jgi:aminoglycoside/choline kinase family phosphotransferase